jgi:predicted ATPase
LKSALKEFGSRSGLFEQIEVIRKGNKESDPFQIGVKSGGPTFNLVDVGYGVSQVLPILVDTLERSTGDEVFLLQQPEVHLHPRAQAELGSFFRTSVGQERAVYHRDS